MDAFRIHARIFGVGACAILVASWLAGVLWPLWGLIAWGFVFAAHYLVFKTRAVDERWAQDRAADLRSKSYDAGHIDAIRRNEGRSPPPDEGRS